MDNLQDRLNDTIITAMKDLIMHDESISKAILLNQLEKDIEDCKDIEYEIHLNSRQTELLDGTTKEKIYLLAYGRYFKICTLLFK